MTTNEMLEMVRRLSDADLYTASLQKNKKGYTALANIAYAERQRRSNSNGTIGSNPAKPDKFSSDYYYYGMVSDEF